MQVEATGVEKLANDAINYVRRGMRMLCRFFALLKDLPTYAGGTLMIYGVYENKALVHWPPSKIFGDEIKVLTFSSSFRLCIRLITRSITDHRLFLADLLLPPRRRVPRRR